jgi:hypothetical protein
MWLFDDLMKKPTPVPTPAPVISVAQDTSWAWQAGQTQWWGNPPQDPFQNNTTPQVPITSSGEVRIEKSAEEAIQTEKPIIQAIELPNTPQPISNTAAEDDGSILMPSDHSIESVETDSMVISDIPDADVVTENVWSDSLQWLREMQLNRMKSPEEVKWISEDQEFALNNLFGNSQEVTEETVNIADWLVETLPEEESTIDPSEKYENPPSFIEASIEKIDVMIAQIEETHTAKVMEAAGYKWEKEKFAALESQAYKDAERMMKERDHGEKMKAYFLKEKDHADERFENSHSFIGSSIEKINFMITHIDMTHTAKLQEAGDYKWEKEKFAALESQAYADGDKMMKEKAHAKRMKTYFLDQKKHSYEVDSVPQKESVETTLATLSVKNSVDVATKDHEPKKASHKKSIEDTLSV